MKPKREEVPSGFLSAILTALRAMAPHSPRACYKNQKPKNVKKEEPSAADATKNSAEPDKVLYERA